MPSQGSGSKVCIKWKNVKWKYENIFFYCDELLERIFFVDFILMIKNLMKFKILKYFKVEIYFLKSCTEKFIKYEVFVSTKENVYKLSEVFYNERYFWPNHGFSRF